MEVIRTPSVTGIVEYLERLLKQAHAGELSTVFVVSFKAGDSTWLSVEKGVRLDRLRAIGVLECMKLDLMRSMDTEE
jgi:hypothetical protein